MYRKQEASTNAPGCEVKTQHQERLWAAPRRTTSAPPAPPPHGKYTYLWVELPYTGPS